MNFRNAIAGAGTDTMQPPAIEGPLCYIRSHSTSRCHRQQRAEDNIYRKLENIHKNRHSVERTPIFCLHGHTYLGIIV